MERCVARSFCKIGLSGVEQFERAGGGGFEGAEEGLGLESRFES